MQHPKRHQCVMNQSKISILHNHEQQRRHDTMNYRPSAAPFKHRDHRIQKKLINALCILLAFALSSTFLSALILEWQWEENGPPTPPSYLKHQEFKTTKEISSVQHVILAGMILDGSLIQSQVWSTIVSLNCKHHVSVHILVETT